jgi:phage/plasmid-associated DNA primase
MHNKKIPKELQPWIEAKKRHRLSQMHIQMARELGMNPKSFSKLDKQERWKAPLFQFIEDLYIKRFGKNSPDVVLSFEQINKLKTQKKENAKKRKLLKKAANHSINLCIYGTQNGFVNLDSARQSRIDPNEAASLCEAGEQGEPARRDHSQVEKDR